VIEAWLPIHRKRTIDAERRGVRSGLPVIRHAKDRLCSELRILLGDPLLDELLKRLRLLQELANLGVRGHIRHVIIEHVPLPPTGLKIARELRHSTLHRELDGFKRGDVMPLPHDKDIDEKIGSLMAMKSALSKLVTECSGKSPLTECPILESLDTTEVTQ
jgi:hypothetical protein